MMYLAKFVARRAVVAVVLLFLVGTITFFATQGLPGDTARALLGQNASNSQLVALRHYLGLDHSTWQQYWQWLHGTVTFKFGNSYINNLPVSSVLGPKIAATAFLAAFGAIIGLTLAFTLAIACALRPGSLLDRAVLNLGVLLSAVPDFVIGLLLILLLATGLLHVLPATALVDTSSALLPQWKLVALPALTLGLIITPHSLYMLRATLVEQLDADYAVYGRLNGMPERKILLREVLPNAIAPSAQVIALGLAYLIGGVVSIEVVFGYPGIGAGLVGAVQYKDLAVVQAITLFATAGFLVLTFLADLIGFITTPKTRSAA